MDNPNQLYIPEMSPSPAKPAAPDRPSFAKTVGAELEESPGLMPFRLSSWVPGPVYDNSKTNPMQVNISQTRYEYDASFDAAKLIPHLPSQYKPYDYRLVNTHSYHEFSDVMNAIDRQIENKKTTSDSDSALEAGFLAGALDPLQYVGGAAAVRGAGFLRNTGRMIGSNAALAEFENVVARNRDPARTESEDAMNILGMTMQAPIAAWAERRAVEAVGSLSKDTSDVFARLAEKAGRHFDQMGKDDLSWRVEPGLSIRTAEDAHIRGASAHAREPMAFSVDVTPDGTAMRFANGDVAHFSDAFLEQREQITQKIEGDLRRIAGLMANKLDVMMPDTLKTGAGESVAGSIMSLDAADLVLIALDRGDRLAATERLAQGTARHEIFHFLAKHGMIQEADATELARMAKSKWIEQFEIAKKYGHLDEMGQIEEAIAEAYRHWHMNGGLEGEKAAGVFGKIKQWLAQFTQALGGFGIRDADAIFRDFESGLARKSETGAPTFGKGPNVRYMRSDEIKDRAKKIGEAAMLHAKQLYERASSDEAKAYAKGLYEEAKGKLNQETLDKARATMLPPESRFVSALGLERLTVTEAQRLINSGGDVAAGLVPQFFPVPQLLKSNMADGINPQSIFSMQYARKAKLGQMQREAFLEGYLEYRQIASKHPVWDSLKTRAKDIWNSTVRQQKADYMSPLEFNEAVWEAHLTGAPHENSVVNKSAQIIRKFYSDFEPEVKQLVSDKIKGTKTWTFADGTTHTENYANRIWDHSYIKQNVERLRQRIIEWEQKLGNVPEDKRVNGIINQILNERPFKPLDVDHIGDAASMKERTFDASSLFFKEFLIRDAEKLASYYSNSMGPKLDFLKVFGDYRMGNAMSKVLDEYAEKSARLAPSEKVKVAPKLYTRTEEYAKGRVIPVDELKQMGDMASSPYLLDDGRVVSTSGDHMDMWDNTLDKKFYNDRIDATYRSFQEDTGHIRFGYFDSRDGARNISINLAPDQKISPAQFATISELYGHIKGTKIYVGILEGSGNPKYEQVVGLEELKKNYTGSSMGGEGGRARSHYAYWDDTMNRAREQASRDFKAALRRFENDPDKLFEETNKIREAFDNASKEANAELRAGMAETVPDGGKIVDRMLEDMEGLRAMRNKVLGREGQFDDPFGTEATFVRNAKNITALTLLTGGIATIPDAGAIALRHGLWRTLEPLMYSMGNGLDRLKLSMKEAEHLAAGAEAVLHARANGIMSMGDMYGRYDRFSAALDHATAAGFTLNLMTPATAIIKDFTTVIAQRDFLEKLANWAKLSDLDKAMFRKYGIGEAEAGKIAAMEKFWDKGNLANKGEGSIWIANTHKWTDIDAVNSFRRLLDEACEDTITTPNPSDLPNWMSHPIGQLVGIFKSFTFGIHNRIVVPALQQRDAKALVGVASMVAMGMIADKLNDIKNGNDKEKSMFDRFMRGFDRAGVGGLVKEGLNVAQGATSGNLVRSVGSIGGAFAGQVARAAEVAWDAGTFSWDKDSAYNLRKLAPGQGWPFLSPMYDFLQSMVTPGRGA